MDGYFIGLFSKMKVVEEHYCYTGAFLKQGPALIFILGSFNIIRFMDQKRFLEISHLPSHYISLTRA